jgi:hypothetical protein
VEETSSAAQSLHNKAAVMKQSSDALLALVEGTRRTKPVDGHRAQKNHQRDHVANHATIETGRSREKAIQ